MHCNHMANNLFECVNEYVWERIHVYNGIVRMCDIMNIYIYVLFGQANVYSMKLWSMPSSSNVDSVYECDIHWLNCDTIKFTFYFGQNKSFLIFAQKDLFNIVSHWLTCSATIRFWCIDCSFILCVVQMCKCANVYEKESEKEMPNKTPMKIHFLAPKKNSF